MLVTSIFSFSHYAFKRFLIWSGQKSCLCVKKRIACIFFIDIFLLFNHTNLFSYDPTCTCSYLIICLFTVLRYGCPFCAVRFSSPRTLEGHLTYYCSKKPPDFISLQDLQQRLQKQAEQSLAFLEKQVEARSGFEPGTNSYLVGYLQSL